jgi:hypothetical protein
MAVTELEINGQNIQLVSKVSELKNDVEYQSKTQVEELIVGKADKNAIVNQTETTVEIQPNVLNVWGEVAELTITLATPNDTSIVNEYMFQFTSGTVATTLALPSNIQWMSEPKINANATYQLSIVNNLAIIGEWSNE